jgi:aminodeoxyfutalosine synthase
MRTISSSSSGAASGNPAACYHQSRLMTVSDTELLALAASHDIIALGMAADAVRRARHDLATTFVRVGLVDAAPGSPVEVPPAAGEIRITGTPATRDAALTRVREVAAKTGNTPLSGFSLSDLEDIALRDRITLRAFLEELRAAGLELVSEAPFERLRDPRCSVEEVNIAGLALARLTINQLPSADVPALYRRIASLQYEVGVIRAFAPLPRTVNPAVPTTGFDDVKRVALARLSIESIPSIQVDWTLYGPKLAQVALTVGADDIDMVSPFDDAPDGRRRAPLEEVRRNIKAAGLEPVERDGRFDRR